MKINSQGIAAPNNSLKPTLESAEADGSGETEAYASAFFEDVNREVRNLPDDLAAIPSIGQRHGIEFMPAPGPAV